MKLPDGQQFCKTCGYVASGVVCTKCGTPTQEKKDEWECPRCRSKMSGPDESCSGSFLDTDHPSNVRAVKVQ